MSPKTLDFKCAIVTGGGGGIGKAISQWLISQGKKVIIVGRTEKTLKDTAQELGNLSFYILDTGNLEDIPSFISTITKEHPDVDCLINNAGVQRPLDVNDFDLSKADAEITINISGPMHLAIGFLPHLKTKPAATIMNVSSVLGYNPFSIINPIYNGTKAFAHFWTMNLRSQLEVSDASKHIKVVEIAPPTVATDLHRERSDPDDNKKENNPNALSLEEFMGEVVNGWKANLDIIAPGPAGSAVKRWYDAFGEEYADAAESFKKNRM